ncbi:membrane protein insertase YidC [Verrucomicrobium sp. BvORR034]|uniref:membrane protein insertase YidC n=1 Tax=Verrucomicrobium sp. BvORR034 TaxID=1396418 RepID=UPI0009DF8521|nr:membrane protein insertase YidC [Verrucomicrobium sp. BvORR034]
MDRKAWIVVTLCAIGMAFNFWWTAKHPPAPAPQPPPASTAPATTTDPAQAAATNPASPANPATPAAPGATAPVAEEKIELKNASAIYTFTNVGGGIASVVMLDTKDHIKLNQHGKAAIGALGTAAKAYQDLTYNVVEKTDKRVVFEALSPEQVLVRKEYSFSEGAGSNDHLVELKVTIKNQSSAKLVRDSYYLYTGAASSLRPDEIEAPAFVWNDAGDASNFATGSFRDGAGFLGFGGPVVELQKNFQHLRWGGVMSRFYTTLISTKADIPAKTWATRFLIDHSNDEFKDHKKALQDYAIHGGVGLPAIELEPNASTTVDYRIYIGAKIFHDLKKIDVAEGQPNRQMQYVMFYGWFTFVSRGLVFMLRWFHDLTGNWGFAIVLLTITVRSLLWPVQARSNATMKRMGLLAPKIKELQEKHKDDPQKVNTEMMRMYREYGVNPLGGCLPLLVQIPIFFGFYAVLRYAAELRGQHFFGWIQDLSLPDTVTTLHLLGYHLPLNPLPLLMGLTMFLQMKLTPQPASADKTQQRIFMLMPFMFLFFCYSFASALALYWTVQNIYSIFQAQVSRLWQKDPVLEKKAVIDVTPGSGSGQSGKDKKDKTSIPRLGGGGSKSRKPKA